MERDDFTRSDDEPTTTIGDTSSNGSPRRRGRPHRLPDELLTDDGGEHGTRHGGRHDGRRSLALPVLVGALLLGLLGGVGGYLVGPDVRDALGLDEGGDGVSFVQPSGAPANKPSNADAKGSSDNSDGALPVSEIYERTAPGVVHISAQRTQSDSSIFGFPQERRGEASGSGFVIDNRGHIVTNAHVVDGATKVTVSFSDDRKLDAEIVGQDVSTDVAVLKVEGSEEDLERALKPLGFADSSNIQVGDPVVAIGNPFNLDRTATTGIVSALQREIEAPNGFRITDVIQTDASINSGNSGGPLLDMRGNVIGVNSQIQTTSGGSVGIGFAVPSNTVKRVATQLVENGKVEHAYIGVVGGDVTPELRQIVKVPVESGVLVFQVAPGSPAAEAGLRAGSTTVAIDGRNYTLGGDIITKFDGEEIESMRELAELVARKKPGDKVEIEFYRDGDKKTATVELEDRPEQTAGDASGR